jgi:hypothetical protein
VHSGDDTNGYPSDAASSAANKAKQIGAAGFRFGKNGAKQAGKKAAVAALTGGSSAAVDAADGARKGANAAKKASSNLPGRNNDFADRGAHSNWGGNARQAAAKDVAKKATKTALKVSPHGNTLLAGKKAFDIARVAAKGFANDVKGAASDATDGLGKKLLFALPILLVLALLIFTVGSTLGGPGDSAFAEEVLPPGVLGNVTVNEADFQAALKNPLLKDTNPNFLKAEVITAARIDGLVPGCQVRWQILHAIAQHETPGFMNWPIDENGNEEQWKIGFKASGPDGNNPPSPYYVNADGVQWDKSTTQDFAVGPYQMLMASWAGWVVNGKRGVGFHMDGNGDGIESPHNVYDAFAASAKYLCIDARDNDPNTVDDFADPSTTDWTTLGAVLYQYAGGNDGYEQQGAQFRDFVEQHTGWLDTINIGVTVQAKPGDGQLPPGVSVFDLPAPLQIVVHEAITTGMNKPYTQNNDPNLGPLRIGPNSFDCSGLIWYLYHQVGINIHNIAADQQAYDGVPVPNKSDLRPGDLVFFSTQPGVSPPHHVGIYIGGGMMVNAHTFGELSGENNIFTDPYYVGQYNGAVRIINPDGSLARRS